METQQNMHLFCQKDGFTLIVRKQNLERRRHGIQQFYYNLLFRILWCLEILWLQKKKLIRLRVQVGVPYYMS